MDPTDAAHSAAATAAGSSQISRVQPPSPHHLHRQQMPCWLSFVPTMQTVGMYTLSEGQGFVALKYGRKLHSL